MRYLSGKMVLKLQYLEHFIIGLSKWKAFEVDKFNVAQKIISINGLGENTV